MGKRRHLDGLDAEFIRGDLRDRKSLNNALGGVDCVVHLAADTRVMDSIENPTYNFDVNVSGTFTLLSAMLGKKGKEGRSSDYKLCLDFLFDRVASC